MPDRTQRKALDRAIIDPSRAYASPESVLADGALEKEEKLQILRSWALDEEALSRAEAENMPATPGEPPAETLLQRINRAIVALEGKPLQH